MLSYRQAKTNHNTYKYIQEKVRPKFQFAPMKHPIWGKIYTQTHDTISYRKQQYTLEQLDALREDAFESRYSWRPEVGDSFEVTTKQGVGAFKLGLNKGKIIPVNFQAGTRIDFPAGMKYNLSWTSSKYDETRRRSLCIVDGQLCSLSNLQLITQAKKL